MNANSSHRALSFSPNINYGSGLKALPAVPRHTDPPAQYPLMLQKPPRPIALPNSIHIYCSALDKNSKGEAKETEILTASNNFSLEIQSFLHRQQW